MEGIACYVVRQAYRRTGYRGAAASLCYMDHRLLSQWS
jgi:hypothetical protein